MNRFFRWTMRHGAKILFALALVQLLATIFPTLLALLSGTREMAANHYYQPSTDGLTLQLTLILHALASAALPLFAALVIDRADRWLDLRERREAAE